MDRLGGLNNFFADGDYLFFKSSFGILSLKPG